MIDRALSYGRENIAAYLAACAPVGRVLDIGAGTGEDLLTVRDRSPNAELFAVELYEPSRRKLEDHGATVWPLDFEREPLPAESESFDVVMANQVLEHVKEVFWILHEMTRTLRVGGRLLLGVPNLASLHNRLLLLFGRQPTPINNASAHIRGFTRHDVVRLLSTCFPGGYQLEQCTGANFYPFPPVVARPFSRLLPNMAWGMFLRLRKIRRYDDGFIRFLHGSALQTSFFDGQSFVIGGQAVSRRTP
jgi:SAM-dependent methyltransferase